MLLIVLGAAGTAAASPAPPGPRHKRSASPTSKPGSPRAKGARLIFPVIGPAQYTNDFGAPRAQGRHQGNDIMAPKKSIAVAVEAGTVKYWNHSWRAGCMLYLYGKSGTTYLYIHLNNDLTMKNDNRGKCGPGVSYAPGLKSGARVAAGQAIGFVGDSGDANGIAPHLHFEVHPRGGGAVNPYPYLNRAVRLLFPGTAGKPFTLALTGSVIGTGTDSLQLRVKSLRSWPGGYRNQAVNRTLVVNVPLTALIERAVTNVPSATASALALSALKRNFRVVVWTAAQPCTLAAQMGREGALVAERVVVYPKK